MTFFLDGVLVALALYFLTQIILPMFFPAELERNWLFKKKRPIENKVEDLTKAKREFSDKVDDALTEAEKLKMDSKELKKATKH